MTQQNYLTQDEIEALLDLVKTSGDVGHESSGTSVAIEPEKFDATIERRDFSKPEALPRADLEFYWTESTHAATKIAGAISKWLRLEVKVECMSIEPALFSSFLGMLTPPCLVYETRAGVVSINPVALSFDPSLALAVVDRVLGGTGKARFASRLLTSVEQTQSKHLASTVTRAISDGLSEVLPMGRELSSGPAMTPRGARYVAGDTPVLIATYSIAGDLAETELRVVVPAAAFPRRETMGNPSSNSGAPPALSTVMVRVSALLGETSISMKDLVSLEVGDVIPLDVEVGSLIQLDAEGRPVALGTFGSHGSKLAVSIEQVLRLEAIATTTKP